MKTIFITGGSTGIGAASVSKFAQEGWNVGFMDINVEGAGALLEKLGNPGNILFMMHLIFKPRTILSGQPLPGLL